MAACQRTDRRPAGPAAVAGRAAAHDVSGLHGGEGGPGAGGGRRLRLSAPAARGDHVRAAQAGRGRGAGRARPARRAWTWSGSASALRSHAITEAFGADLEATEALAGEAQSIRRRARRWARDGVPLPTAVFQGGEAAASWSAAPRLTRRTARPRVACGAEPVGDGRLGVEQALARFGRLTTREVEVLCELPGPRAAAELWGLAEAWKVRAVPVLTGLPVGGRVSRDSEEFAVHRAPSLQKGQPRRKPALSPTRPTLGSRTVPALSVTSPITRAPG